MRKVIQVTVSLVDDAQNESVLVVCEDGTLWHAYNPHWAGFIADQWAQVTPIPQDEETT